MEKSINYIFKEHVDNYGISRGIRGSISHNVNSISNQVLIQILEQQAVYNPRDIKVKYITMGVQQQLEIEERLYEQFMCSEPGVMDWIHKMVANMRVEHEKFIHTISTGKRTPVVKYYVELLSKQPQWGHMLMYSLVYYHSIMAFYCLHMGVSTYYAKLTNVLLSLLGGTLGKKYMWRMGDDYHNLAVEIGALMEVLFIKYFTYNHFLSKINGTMCIRINFAQNYTDIP